MYLNRPLRLLLSAILVICASTIGAQIVNVEKKRTPTDSTWVGSIELSFAGSKTTKSTVSILSGGTLQYKPKNEKDFWLFDTKYSLVSGDGEKFSNTGYGYILYNRRIGDGPFKFEAFTTLQYNGLTKINMRANGGAGIRIKLTPEQYKLAKFYFGIAYMSEYEELLEPVDYIRENRISSYFTFTLEPYEGVTFVSTTYAQPRVNEFNDYRLCNETSLNLGITKKLTLSTTFNYNYDAAPPEGVPTSTYYFINGLELEF